MPGWPGGLGNRLQDGRAAVDQGLGDRLQNWWNSTTFFKPAYEDLVAGLTAPGDVMSGAQPTMAADPQTGEFHTDPRLADRAGALAGAVTLGAGAVPAEADALRMGIKAYHASPHDFERFDASKIGTGQGAQSFGHGIYVAENPRVSGRGGQYDREFTAKKLGQSDTTPQQEYILNRLDEGASDLDILKGLAQGGGTDFEQAQGMLDKVKANRAKIYEVDIAADPEHFLDWDKPLSEQPSRVRGALEAQGMRVPDGITQLPSGRWAPTSGGEVVGRPDGWPTKGDAQTASQMIVEGLPKTGEQIYRQAAKDTYAIRGAKDQRWEPTGKTFEESLAMVGGDHSRVLRMRSGGGKDSADALREAGIPGIKYLDQGSRAAGEGSRNFVVFDDKLISILKKYGLPISAAGLAALSQLHPQEAQAQPLGDRLQGR